MSGKPCAFKLQGLRDHIEGVARVAEAFIESSNLHKVAARRLGLDPQLVKSYMILSAKAHDLGKAMDYYQRQFDESCKAVSERFNFMDHEVFSGAMLMKAKEEVLKAYGDCELCFGAAVVAVLLHHHAMRVHDPTAITGSKRDEFLAKAGKVIKDGLDERLGFVIPEEVTPRDLDRLAFNLVKLYGQTSRSSRAYLYFLTPLVIADYADGAKRVESEKRTFSLIVLDILKEWGVKVEG